MHHTPNDKKPGDFLTREMDPVPECDDITDLAALICGVPAAAVSLMVKDRVVFKSRHGLEITETPVENSFCAQTMRSPNEPLVIEDARKDPAFKNYSLVKEKPYYFFYVGIALMNSEGNAVGALSVMDKKPRKLEKDQLDALKALGRQVEQLFKLRKFQLKLEDVKDDLSEESNQLKNIIDATRAGTWEWHVPSGKVTVNQRWAEMLGYTLEELQPLTIEDLYKLILPKDAETIDEKTRACFENKSDIFSGDFQFYHKKGHLVWIHDRGQVVSRTPDGKPLVIGGTHIDITEKRNRETQFESIANNIPGAVFRYRLFSNDKDELEQVSAGAQKLWGYSAEEVMQNNHLIWDRYHEDDLKVHHKSIRKSAKNFSFWEHEWRYRHPDGTLRWHKGSGNPTQEDGSITWDSIILDITTQKESELELEKSEQRFKSLVQNGSDLICILDQEANFLYVSPNCTKILGTPPEEFIGESALHYIHPDDKNLVFESLSRLKNQKRDGPTTIRFKHGDGTWRWLETTATNLLDDQTVGGFVANSRDVTDRILTEDKLIKSEAYYRGLSESQTTYLIRVDLEGNYSYVNEKFKKEFSRLYPDGNLLGKNSMTSIMEYHHEKTRETVAKCIDNPGQACKVELDKPTPEGKVVTTLWDFLCVLDAEGNPAEIQCMGLDITDRIKSEEALKESEHRYSNLFHLSPQPMWVYELKTMKFLDVNNAAIHHYGYSYEDFMNMTLRDIRPKSEIPKLERSVSRLLSKEKNLSRGTYWHQKKNGEKILVEIKGNLLSYNGKQADLALVTDITERKKHLTAIETQNKKLREIAWKQSHLVRAPLTNVMGLIQLLSARSDSTEDNDHYLRLLMQSTQELDDVIQNIVKSAEA